MGINGGDDSDSKYAKEIDRLLRIAIVVGRPTGVELSTELADFKSNDVEVLFGGVVSDRLQTILVEASPRNLGPFDSSLADIAEKHLQDRYVEVRTSVAVTKVEDAYSVTFAPSKRKSFIA
jgi:NADH dehydrogenase